MAFYFDSIRPRKRQSSSNDITNDHAAFLWYCMNQWCDLVGPDYAEMSCDFDAIASDSSPAVGMIMKGPKADINAAHPTAFVFDMGSTYARTYQRFDYVKGSNVSGSYSSSELLVMDSRSDASYYNGTREASCYWSDTPGSRYFIFSSILGTYCGVNEVPVFNENMNVYDDQNIRWMHWAHNTSKYNLLDAYSWADTKAKGRKYDVYDDMYWYRQPQDNYRIGSNIPIDSPAMFAVGHMKDQFLIKGQTTSNQLVKKDNMYYYNPYTGVIMFRVA